jgi:hypothetical protein
VEESAYHPKQLTHLQEQTCHCHVVSFRLTPAFVFNTKGLRSKGGSKNTNWAPGMPSTVMEDAHQVQGQSQIYKEQSALTSQPPQSPPYADNMIEYEKVASSYTPGSPCLSSHQPQEAWEGTGIRAEPQEGERQGASAELQRDLLSFGPFFYPSLSFWT